jgi:hypothetical protein
MSELVTGRENIVSNHFLGGALHLMRVFFARDRMRGVIYPTRLLALRNFFSNPEGTRSDVWSWTDPKPAFMEVIDILKKRLWK